MSLIAPYSGFVNPDIITSVLSRHARNKNNPKNPENKHQIKNVININILYFIYI